MTEEKWNAISSVKKEDDELELSRAIFRTFNSDDGRVTLSWILSRCGFFPLEGSKAIDPSLISFANDLMRAGRMGVSGDAGAFADALLRSHKD